MERNKQYQWNLYSCGVLLFIFIGCTTSQKKEESGDFKKFYDEFHVTGSFILYNQTDDHYVYYNKAQSEKQFTPASTYKIFNSMVGLETGVIADENFVIPWDSVIRRPVWNHDHDLKSAFEHSTVWYYQELARRVGGKQMKYWLDKAAYGNADTTGGIDRFWLDGSLRITPIQQIDLLERMYAETLPFSKRSMVITKEIMKTVDTLGGTVYGKTGWGMQDGEDIGWFVGFFEKDDQVYFFSNCIQMSSEQIKDPAEETLFDRSRREIVYKVLEEVRK